ncbi:MAG: chemotaxis protein CheW, partial [Halobaculum sp.]
DVEAEADAAKSSDTEADAEAEAEAAESADTDSGADTEIVNPSNSEVAVTADSDSTITDNDTGKPDDSVTADSNTATADSDTATDPTTTDRTESFQVIEFELGSETFALDIEYVEAIERIEGVAEITRVPGTPAHVLGVTAIREQTTSLVDPDRQLGTDAGVREGDAESVIVLDPDSLGIDRQLGVLIERVTQVSTVEPEQVRDPPSEDEYVAGVIDRDGEFVVWTTPAFALDE